MTIMMQNPLVEIKLGRRFSFGVQDLTLFAIWLLFSLAAAFRWFGEGRDYSAYLEYYEKIPFILSFSDTRFEPGFHSFAWFCQVVLGLNFETFFLIIVGLAFAIKIHLFRRYLSSPVLATVTYLLMIYPIHEYTQIRAALGISIGLLSIHFWLNGWKAWAVTATLIAVLFHSSALVLFCAFLFAEYFQWNWKGGLVVFALAFLALVSLYLNIPLLSIISQYNPLVIRYVENATLEQEASFFSLGNALFIVLLISGFFAGWADDRYRRSFYIIAMLSVMSLGAFAASPTVAQRIKEVLFGAIIFAAYRFPATERDLPALGLLWVNAIALGWLSVQNGLFGA